MILFWIKDNVDEFPLLADVNRHEYITLMSIHVRALFTDGIEEGTSPGEAYADGETPFHEVLRGLKGTSGCDENKCHIQYIWIVPRDQAAALQDLLVIAIGSAARHHVHIGLPGAV
jgi:hypothetical protein